MAESNSRSPVRQMHAGPLIEDEPVTLNPIPMHHSLSDDQSLGTSKTTELEDLSVTNESALSIFKDAKKEQEEESTEEAKTEENSQEFDQTQTPADFARRSGDVLTAGMMVWAKYDGDIFYPAVVREVLGAV